MDALSSFKQEINAFQSFQVNIEIFVLISRLNKLFTDC